MPKRKPITAGELLDKLYADPEWVAAKQERDRVFAERAAFLQQAQSPLIQELNAAGVVVKSVWDLVNTSARYPAAVPILLAHLTQPYPQRIREGIARALAVRESNQGWAILMKAFREEADNSTMGTKWAFALALAGAATDKEMDDLIPLYRDQSLGENRAALMFFLKRSRDPRADQILDELAQDPTLAHDAAKIQRGRQRRKRP